MEERIGHGAMGDVYRAYDTRLPRRVALKMLPVELVRDPELLHRLAQEARAAASINHPSVATIYDFEEHGEESFIVYEYVDGVTLQGRLPQRFSVDEVIEVGIQLAEALCAAHDRGIVHRDLKPANLMLVSGPEGRMRVKILDFGLAKFLKPLTLFSAAKVSQAETGSGTTAGAMVGTLNYMSPEQVQGKEVDSRTDVYAVGLVLYEMTTGVNPFQGEVPASTIANILTGDPPPMADLNPACPMELDRILRRCLRKLKEERYQSPRELLEGLLGVRGPHAPAVEVNGSREQMPRGPARALFILIQAGYLAMYTAAFCFPTRVEEFLALFKVPHLALMVMFSALCGAALRLYFISAAALDYPDTGRLFRWVFPAVLALDAVWAAAPLTLFYKLGYPVLLMTAGLAYLPFSQRTLVSYAYAPRGGRISAAGRRSSIPRS